MKGPVYEKYIVPFMLGDTSFLSLFSLKDQEKFLMFLQGHHLLARRGGGGIGQYHRVRSSGRRSSTLDEKLDEMLNNYMYTRGIFDFDPNEPVEEGDEDDEGEEVPHRIYDYRKNEFEDTYHTDRGEFDTARNDMRIRGQEALDEYYRNSTRQYLQGASRNPDDRLFQQKLREFSRMRPAEVSRLLAVPNGTDIEGGEFGEEF